MANVKISDLTALTISALADLLEIVDIGADESKKITIQNLMKITNLLAELTIPATNVVVSVEIDTGYLSVLSVVFAAAELSNMIKSPTVIPPTGFALSSKSSPTIPFLSSIDFEPPVLLNAE